MFLYVMRHAEAVDGNEALRDEWRYLTEKGRQSAEKISYGVAKYGPKPRLIVTSPLTRAVQTAEIMAARACRKNVVVSSALLMPGGDVADVIEYLKDCGNSKRVMLVGHEPQLGLLVSALLGREHEALPLKKGACVALEIDPAKADKPAAFLWYLVPGKKLVMSLKKAFSAK